MEEDPHEDFEEFTEYTIPESVEPLKGPDLKQLSSIEQIPSLLEAFLTKHYDLNLEEPITKTTPITFQQHTIWNSILKDYDALPSHVKSGAIFFDSTSSVIREQLFKALNIGTDYERLHKQVTKERTKEVKQEVGLDPAAAAAQALPTLSLSHETSEKFHITTKQEVSTHLSSEQTTNKKSLQRLSIPEKDMSLVIQDLLDHIPTF
jgi:hypothetical protein